MKYTTAQITSDVDRALALVAKMKADKKELEAIEARLVAAALERDKIPLEDEGREGQQFLACGSSCAVPVRFESDSLMATLPDEGPSFDLVKAACGVLFPKLWSKVTGYARKEKDGDKFRRNVRELAEPDRAAEIINATLARDKKTGLVKSRTVIAWENTRPLPVQG